LGRQSKSTQSKKSRNRIAYTLPIAAAPALVGLAATIGMAPQQASAATTTAARPATQHAAAAAGTRQPGNTHALLSVNRRAAERRPAEAVSYTVRSGDSLSAIAGRFYHNPSAWPVIFWANHSQIRWANLIDTGQVLRVPAEAGRIPAAPGELGPHAPAPATAAQEVPARQAPVQQAPVQQAPVQQAAVQQVSAVRQAPAQSTGTYTGGTPGGSFGQCVVAHESGGNAQVMNSSGHYGLYQFSSSTWAAYGGNPADFGHASVSEQDQVFATAIAQGGQSNWAPYDGC